MRRRKAVFAAAVFVLFSVWVLALSEYAGDADPTDPPGSTFSYTLNDIYNRLLTGAEYGPSTFTEPTDGPGTPTMHTLDEIMDLIPGFIVNVVNGDSTVTDLQTKLMWTKNADHGLMTWQDAKDYCDNLDFAGHSNWRMPHMWELYTLLDKRQSDPALPAGHPFTGVQSIYWSGTVTAASSDQVWILYPSDGHVSFGNKGGTLYVWPVRNY